MQQHLLEDHTSQSICQGIAKKFFYMKKRGMTRPWKNTKKITQLIKRRDKSSLIGRMRIEGPTPLHPVTLQIRMRL